MLNITDYADLCNTKCNKSWWLIPSFILLAWDYLYCCFDINKFRHKKQLQSFKHEYCFWWSNYTSITDFDWESVSLNFIELCSFRKKLKINSLISARGLLVKQYCMCVIYEIELYVLDEHQKLFLYALYYNSSHDFISSMFIFNHIFWPSRRKCVCNIIVV